MDFGLGLVLSFTDNATAGINNAVNSLNRLTGAAEGAMSSLDRTASLSALSVVAGQMGNSFTSAGSKIIGTLQGVLNNVQSTGAEFQAFGLTLNKLYGDETKATEALDRLLSFSVKSPFNVDEVKDMLIVLKSQGIDAFEEVTGAARGFTQENLSWIADLMAFKPDEPMQRWKRALTNYLGSGQDLMLRNMLDMGKITDILGHEMGATPAERMKDIMEIVESINLEGYAAQMQNTMVGMSSNVADAMTKIYKAIADAGVFQKLMDSFANLKGVLLSLTDDEILTLGQTIAAGFNILLIPVVKSADMLNELFHSIVDLTKTRPEVVKWGIVFAGIAGAVLISIGIFLKATSALSGLSLMYLAFGSQFGSISTLFAAGATKILGALLPLTLAIATLYYVWSNDLGGIATAVTNFVGSIVRSFSVARDSVSGSLSNMYRLLRTFDTKNNFFDGLTLAIMRLMTLGRALVEGWNDYEMSYDTFMRVEALGIRPLVEAIFDLKYRFDHFVQGFKEGFGTVLQTVTGFFASLTGAVDGTVFGDALNAITGFFQAMTNNDPDAWTRFGKSLGDIAAKAVLLVSAFGVVRTAFGLLSGIASVVVAPIVKGILSITKMLGGLRVIVGGLFSLILAHPVIAVIVGVVSALALLYTQSEKFRGVVQQVFGQMREVFFEISAAFLPLIQRIVEVSQSLLPQLLGAFSRIGQAVAPMIENIGSLIVQIIPPIAQVIGTVIATVLDLLPAVMNVIGTIADVIAVVYGVISDLVALAVPFIVQLVDMLGDLISGVLPVIADLVSTVLNVLSHAVSIILPALQSIFKALMPIIKTLLNIVTTIVSRLIPIIKSLVSIISNVIKAVMSIITPVIRLVAQVAAVIVNVLSPIVDVILQAAGFIIDIVLGIVQMVITAIDTVVGIVSGLVQIIVGIIDTIVQFIMMVVGVIVGVVQVIVDTVAGIISGIIGVVQAVWDGIVNVFSNVYGFFSGVFNSVFEIAAGVFTRIADFFNTVWNGIVTVFATLGDTISGVIKGAINSVIGGAVRIINGFIKAINFAISAINAIPGVEISKLNELVVPALALGGIVTKPTTALIGEAGAEAVMPLENNLGWITILASEIGKTLFNSSNTKGNITPVYNTNTNNTSTNTSNITKAPTYMTTTNSTNAPVEHKDDHSVTFSQGSIVVYANSMSEAEAEKFANLIIEKVKQKQRVEKVMSYDQ